MNEVYEKLAGVNKGYKKLARMVFDPKETFDDNFGTINKSKKIRNIAFSAIKDHNAIKGQNLCFESVLQARVMDEDVLGSLYLLDLLVRVGDEDNLRITSIRKMVWVGESKESIICFKPRFKHFIYTDEDYQFDFDFKKPFPKRPSCYKIKELAEFALHHFNSQVAQGYNFRLENKKNVKITLGKWGSWTYRKGAAGYSEFNVFLFDLNKLSKNKHIPQNLMVVTKRWLQTLDDEKSCSFLHNLVRPRHYPVRKMIGTAFKTFESLLAVDLESPMVVTMVWFAVEDELFKRKRELEFVRVVHGTKTLCSGRVFHLTIEARDQGVLKKFDTSVWVRGDMCIASPFVEITPPSESLVNSTAGRSHRCCTKTL